MKLTKKDFAIIAPVVVLLAVLITSIGREKAKAVPADDKHRPFYEAMERGADRAEEERRCITCHNPQAVPLPKKHPPKEQCLICHKLRHAKQ
jgi:hypothetical protein